MTTGPPLCPTTIVPRAPVPVDRLERVLKVPWNPPKVMGEHTPLHACACLDHACRVRLIFPRHLLIGLSVYHFPVINATSLHLSVESDTMKPHIRARGSLYRAVMGMVVWDRTLASSHTMTQPVWYRTFFCKMSPHCAIFAPARSSSCGLSSQLSRAV